MRCLRRQREDRSVLGRTAARRRPVEGAVHVGQGSHRMNAITGTPEAVQYALLAARRNTKDGSAAAAGVARIRTAVLGRPVERTLHGDQGRDRSRAVGPDEAMDDGFVAA